MHLGTRSVVAPDQTYVLCNRLEKLGVPVSKRGFQGVANAVPTCIVCIGTLAR